MQEKTEKLDEQILNNLKDYQSKLSDFTFELGQIEINFLQLKSYKTSIENEYKKTKMEFDEVVKGLEEKYPNGEINLTEGTVTYQE